MLNVIITMELLNAHVLKDTETLVTTGNVLVRIELVAIHTGNWY